MGSSAKTVNLREEIKSSFKQGIDKLEESVNDTQKDNDKAVIGIPVVVQLTDDSNVVVPRTLKEKVLNYINKHPEGVKISEMEEPLGEIRMKLGFTAKALLDAGKVKKIDKVYYPEP